MKLYDSGFSPFVRMVLDHKGLACETVDGLDKDHARAWERCADSVIDPILVDISYWSWAERDDRMPDGLRDVQADPDRIYDAPERDLPEDGFLCGDLSIADIALFPHMTAVRMLRVSFTPKGHPKLSAWFKRMRQLEIRQSDLARGHHDCFMNEIAQQRVLWPSLPIPAPNHLKSTNYKRTESLSTRRIRLCLGDPPSRGE